LLEEADQKRAADAFEDARFVEAFKFECSHDSLKR
jgi:hypothetical protein